MKQPPLDGMAVAKSLYGSDQDARDENIATHPQKDNLSPEQLKKFLSYSFDTSRADGAYQKYEQFKKRIDKQNLAPKERERKLIEYANLLGI